MAIYVGCIEKYVEDRGFGFINCVFPEKRNENIFFHISAIKKTNENFFNQIQELKYQNIYFWFETENSDKGERLKKVITLDHLKNCLGMNDFLVKIKQVWENFDIDLPKWTEFVTSSLMSNVEVEKLQQKRIENLHVIHQQRVKKQEEWEKQRVNEIDKELNKYLKDSVIKYSDNEINEMRSNIINGPSFSMEDDIEWAIKNAEFEHLVSEMQMLNFSESSQVSNYIVRKKLGRKYEHISGYLTMANNHDIWEFKGGFPSDIYARLCTRLNIQGRGTNTRAIGFRSFRQDRNR